jgi:hypothetical protein
MAKAPRARMELASIVGPDRRVDGQIQCMVCVSIEESVDFAGDGPVLVDDVPDVDSMQRI